MKFAKIPCYYSSLATSVHSPVNMMVASSSESKVGLVLQCLSDRLQCFPVVVESAVEGCLCSVLLLESPLPPMCY